MTPRAPVAALPGLAPRPIRLAAAAVDAFLAIASYLVTIFGAFACFGASSLAFGAKREWFEKAGSALTGVVGWVVFIGGLLGILCLLLYQWYLLSTRGQTIGKSLFGIRIVSLEGQPVGFVRALLLRDWVYFGLLSVVVSASSAIIPIAGVLLALLNYVPMFGEDRRCLHDYVAGTQVRWVRIVEVHVGRLVGAIVGVALVGGGAVVAVNHETIVPLLSSSLQQRQPVATGPTMTSAPEPTLTVPVVVEQTRLELPPVAEPDAQTPTPSAAQVLYQFIDNEGVVHVTDDLSAVPERYRSTVTNP